MGRRLSRALVTAAVCALSVGGFAYLLLPDVLAWLSNSGSCAICWVPPLLTIGGATGAAAAAGGYWGWSVAEKEREAKKARDAYNSYDPNEPDSSQPGPWVEDPMDGSPPILHAPDPDEGLYGDNKAARFYWDTGKSLPGELGESHKRTEDFMEDDWHLGSYEPEDDD